MAFNSEPKYRDRITAVYNGLLRTRRWDRCGKKDEEEE